jgi:hypothetical protein
MGMAHCKINTEVGEAEVEQTGPDRFRVFVGDAAVPGSDSRYSVAAHMFMSSPGEFIDVTREGLDSVLVLPKNCDLSMPDPAIVASDLEEGIPLVVGPAIAPPASEDDEAILRRAVRGAVERVYDRIYGGEGFEPEVEEEDATPSWRM